MTSTLPTVGEGLAEASEFARDVWRDCWAVMLVVVTGRTLVFMGHHIAPIDWSPGLWPKLGELLTLAYIPLFGALYRLGVGGEALDSLGWGGLQWTGVEWRLLGVWLVLGFALSLCATPLAVFSLPLLYLFQHRSAVSLGPFGGWSLASILLAPFWLAFAAFALFMWGRLGLSAATTTARGRVSPFASWNLTRGLGWTIGLAWLATQIPMVLGWIALWVMGMAEAGDFSSGPAETWPLVDATAAGAVIGVLAAVIQAPLSVGLLCGFRRWLAPDDETAEAHLALDDETLTEVAPQPEPEPQEPQGALSAWPHTVLPRGSPIPARAEAPEPGGPPSLEAHPHDGEAEDLHPLEPLVAETSDPVHEDLSVAPADAQPPLASAPEAGQTSHTDPEPHA